MVSQQLSLPSLLALKSILHMVVLLPCWKSFIGFHCPQDEVQVTPVTYKAFCYLASVCPPALSFSTFCHELLIVFPYPSLLMFSLQLGMLLNWLIPIHSLRCSDIAHYPQVIYPWAACSPLGSQNNHRIYVQLVCMCVGMHMCMCLNGYLFTVCFLVCGVLNGKNCILVFEYHLIKYLEHNRHGIE